MWAKPYSIDESSTGDSKKTAILKIEDNADYVFPRLDLVRTTFYGATDPTGPDAGQFYYDSVSGELFWYDGTDWVVVSLPSGTAMWFYNSAAPTAWTLVAAATDRLLAVKGGSNAYNVSGGTLAGTWTQPNHGHTLSGGHTHTIATHSHSLSVDNSNQWEGSGYCLWPSNATDSAAATTNSVVVSIDNAAPADTWRPAANVGIVCSKD